MSTEAATDGGVEAIAVAVDRVGGGGDARTARFASFVSRFRPDAAAREAYAAHTKRAHDGNVEEFRLFFEIDERAAASAPRAGDRRRAAPGLVHCTLPTRVRAPTPRSHVDGPFMLSVDRHSLDANHGWNAALLDRCLGDVLAQLLAWAARRARAAPDDAAAILEDAYGRLPTLERDEKTGRATCAVAGGRVALRALDDALRRDAIVPTLPLGTFARARDCCWVPPAFAARVDASTLAALLGRPAVATHVMGANFAAYGLWRGALTAPAPRRGVVFKGDPEVAGPALVEAAAAARAAAGDDDGGVDAGAWPVWLSSTLELVAASRVRFLDDDFARLPPDVRDALGGAAARAAARLDGATPQRGKAEAPALLHHAVATALGRASRAARDLVDELRRDARAVVTVGLAAAAAQRDWAARWPREAKDLEGPVVRFATWAVEHRRAELLTHAIDDAADRPGLRAVATLSLGARYGDALSRFAAPGCRTVSARYVDGDSAVDARAWADAWRSAGASDGAVRVVANCGKVDLRRAKQLVAAARSADDATPHVGDGELGFRKTQPASSIPLPYDLLDEMDRRHAYVVDATLAPEWLAALDGADAARCRSFAACVARRRVEAAPVPSAKAVAAARRTLDGPAKGRGGGDDAARAVDDAARGVVRRADAAPLRKRLYWLPPGQAAASAVDLGPAAWVVELRRRRWIPAAWRDNDALPPVVVAPSMAALENDDDPRRPLAAFGANDASVRAALCASSSPWSPLLRWATATPPPPLDQLLELLAREDPAPSDLAAAWLLVGRGAAALDAKARRDVLRAATAAAAALPRATGGAAPLAACVSLDEGPDALSRSLVDAGFLVDVRAPGGPLERVAAEVAGLLSLPRSASRSHARAFVRRLCADAPATLRGVDAAAFAESVFAAGPRRDALAASLPELSLPCAPLDGPPALVWLPAFADGGVRPVLVDDDVKRACLGASHGYLPLAALVAGPRAGAVVDALRVSRLSAWTLRTGATGMTTPLGDASGRFGLVLRLLGDDGAAPPPGLYRRGGLSRELRAPNGNKTTTKLFALWGKVKGVDGRQCLLAGDPDDYAPALEDLALGRPGARGSFDAHTRNALRLLSALEDGARFDKLAARDFASDARVARWRADRREAAAVEALRGAVAAAADAATLGGAIAAFVAACPDAAPPVLDNARAAEAALLAAEADAAAAAEARAAAKREAKAQRKSLMAEADSLLESMRTEADADDDDDEYAPDGDDGGAPPPPPPPQLPGRGRGVSNLPAWMTSPEGSQKRPREEEEDAGGDGPPPAPARAEPAPIPGRGRGVSNLPAWMTGGVPEPPPAAPPSPPRKRERDQFEDAAEPAAKRVAPASADAELRAALLRLATDDFAAFSALIEEVRSRAAPR